jgi:hypothetical protein
MAHSRFKVYMSKNRFFQAFVANRNVGQSVVVQVVQIPVSVASRSTPYLITPVETMPKAAVSHPSE